MPRRNAKGQFTKGNHVHANPTRKSAPPRRHKSTPAFERLYGKIYRTEREEGRSAGRARYIAEAKAGQIALMKRGGKR